MLYRPNFCCNCGEKIERADWNLLTSRRFCDPCRAELSVADWAPKILTAIVLLAGFALISSFSKPSAQSAKSEVMLPPVETARSTPVLRDSNSNTTLPLQVQSQPPTIPGSATTSNTVQANVQPRSVKSSEVVYFCGALTKKGTPCSRRVKNAGDRCWQHAGMPAAVEIGPNSGR